MFLVVPSFATDTEEWGGPANGLRMSVSIVSVEGGVEDVRLVLQNTGDKDLAVLTGFRVGSNCEIFPYFGLLLKDRQGAVQAVRREMGVGSGGFKPCTVVHHPGEDRSFREPESHFVVAPDTHHQLPAVLAQGGEFWVEFEPRAESVKAGCGGIPCWLGKIVSNTLVLPAH